MILKNHPFAIEAHFNYSVVLTFAFPKEQLASLLPECLTLDTYQDQWAFIAVAIVQTQHLRIKGFPKFTGNNFLLTGYRVFVRYTNNKGKRLRGLYILKSETDKRRMQLLGSLFTQYSYTTTDLKSYLQGPELQFVAKNANFCVKLKMAETGVNLPPASPFTDWKEARKFAGPLPFTFTYNPATHEVLIVEGVRENWIPQPIKVESYEIPYLESSGLKGGRLANAFIIHNIPYSWKKGRTEIWKR